MSTQVSLVGGGILTNRAERSAGLKRLRHLGNWRRGVDRLLHPEKRRVRKCPAPAGEQSVLAMGSAMRKAILMMLLAVLSSSAAKAGQDSYFCAVENVYLLDDKGRIKENASLTRIMRGDRFSVDRLTGNVAGERIPAFPLVKSSVLFPGGKGNSFKSYFQGYNFVSYLEVYEYKDGEEKPFVLHDGASIFSGFCE